MASEEPGVIGQGITIRGNLSGGEPLIIKGMVSPHSPLPAYLAARRLRVPLVVHEANARPGLANRLGARMTRHVGVATPDVRLPHATHVGIPLRRSISTLDRGARRLCGQRRCLDRKSVV